MASQLSAGRPAFSRSQPMIGCNGGPWGSGKGTAAAWRTIDQAAQTPAAVPAAAAWLARPAVPSVRHGGRCPHIQGPAERIASPGARLIRLIPSSAWCCSNGASAASRRSPRPKGGQRFRALVEAKALAGGGLPGLGQNAAPAAADRYQNQCGSTVRVGPANGAPHWRSRPAGPRSPTLTIKTSRQGLTIAPPQQQCGPVAARPASLKPLSQSPPGHQMASGCIAEQPETVLLPARRPPPKNHPWADHRHGTWAIGSSGPAPSRLADRAAMSMSVRAQAATVASGPDRRQQQRCKTSASVEITL